ncbi:23S rRNA (uracil(1939)-C(5))-methyltransferase RlmD [Eupransor demetentiae]|uniref:TrmA/RlmC/RlmD family (TrmA) n=1 Tax=Eupransor demetentiae TaxID=3109584 RepID=A0ABP0ET77_9LACO|nr:TrmA/RlmC/RlmD family (TrmA) [Lactobacillaceae bacterium LMG 33000]
MAKTIPPVKLHQVLTGKVDAIRDNGMGIIYARPDYPLYLADVMPDEEVRIEIIQVDKHSAYAKVLDWLKPSPQRQNQDRQYLIEAGTAPLVNWSYPAQEEFKKQRVARAFEQAGLQIELAPIIAMTEPTYYRNKTVVPLKWVGGKLLSGFYQRGTHKLVEMKDYYVNDAKIDQAILKVRQVLEDLEISAFNPDTEEGCIRYIMVRRGYYSHELMVVLVSNEATLPLQDEIVAGIRKALPELTSLILNISPKKDYVLLSPHNELLWGKDRITDTLLGYKFLIGPNSFYQVNPTMTEKLYAKAAELAELKPTDLVIDAYSGIGTIGISVAKQVKKVIGVEVVPGAVADAQRNLAQNQITNADYRLADAPAQFIEWAKEGIKPDVVFVDPPRRGLTEELIEATAQMQPHRVVYISCNPVTAARDCAKFKEKGYEIVRPVQAVDQFPQTAHVETITVLDRIKK